jgi:hypothetical protein
MVHLAYIPLTYRVLYVKKQTIAGFVLLYSCCQNLFVERKLYCCLILIIGEGVCYRSARSAHPRCYGASVGFRKGLLCGSCVIHMKPQQVCIGAAGVYWCVVLLVVAQLAS